MALTMAVAALAGNETGWITGVFCYIAQLGVLLRRGADTGSPKSMCVARSAHHRAGELRRLNFIYAIVEAFTAIGGDSPGGSPTTSTKSLDATSSGPPCKLQCARSNCVVYSGIVKNYGLQTVIS
ncbi:hypothetical protein ZWY2020_030229 [Hordeum vulgare]|nr:hypothetical protein ZWY2020_030229 [Hordeum vulgare]